MRIRTNLRIRLLSIFVSGLLLMQYTPRTAAQADLIETSKTTQSSSLQEPPIILDEDIALREQNVKHFLLTDGSYTAVVYDEPVHYQKGSEWTEIDNSLSQAVLIGDPLTGTVKRSTEQSIVELRNYQNENNINASSFCTDYLENTDNEFKVQLPTNISSDAPVMVSYGGHTLRFRFNDIAAAVAEARQPVDETALDQELQSNLAGVTDKEARAKIQNDYAAAVTKSHSSVSYTSIQSGVDLNYYISGEKLKEDLVLHGLPETESFMFDFTYTGLRAVLEENDSVTFYNKDSEAIFMVAAPYMFDAEDGYSTDIAVTLEETETGCRYILTPDRDWLEDPARIYPITLDPTVTTTQNSSYIHDNGVQQSDPTTNYKLLNRIYVGTYRNGSVSQEGRMYIKLTQWPSLPTGCNITDARMRLSYYPTASYQTAYQMWIDVYRVNSSWNTDTITWNNQTNIGATFMSDKYLTDSRGKTSGYDEFNVTSWVKDRYINPSADQGIRLQPYYLDSSKTNRVCYISSDYSTSSLRPIIYIDYNDPGPAPGITSGAVYYIRNKHSSHYLDASGAPLDGNVLQHSFHGELNQQWQVMYIGSGFYTIKNLYYHYNGKVLDVSGGSNTNGANIQVYGSNNSNAQKWRIISDGDGSYILMSAVSATRVMDVEGKSTASPANVHLWDYVGGDSQKWYFEQAYNYGCKGYAVYCNLPLNVSIDWHAGFMDEPYATNTLSVIHMGSSLHNGIGVQWADWNDFLAGSTYQGVYRPNQAMNDYDKGQVISMAREFRTKNIGYILTTQIRATVWPDAYWIYPEDVVDFRCDGLVEYCYEYFGFRIYGDDARWDITRADPLNIAHHSISSITPKIQAQNYMKKVGSNVPNPVP